MTIPWKPAGRPTLIPVLPGGRKLIDFVTSVFGAKVAGQHGGHSGRARLGVPDVDAAYKKALAAGAKSVQEPTDQFYGDRTARIVDPFGNQWAIATHKEDVSEEELKRRIAAMSKG